MYSLTPPTRDHIADFDNITARRPSVASLLAEQRPAVVTAYKNYLAQSGKGSSLHPISVTAVGADALRNNFDALDRGRSHAYMRDEILASAPSDYCPYCNISPVDTIDHALPKSVYPEFSVLAPNLVPACSACNRDKSDVCHQTSGYDLMHPYYVSIPDEPILFAEVTVHSQAIAWRFYLRNDVAISQLEFMSIQNLFIHLDLADRFYRQSAGDILDRAGHFDELHKSAGADALRDYLSKEADSSRKSRGNNYWKTAILRALADNDPFCDGGYKNLPVPKSGLST